MQHRTIDMSEPRRQQVALAAAASGVSSHQWIQAAITAGLLSQAEADPALALAFLRSAGVSWQDLDSAAKTIVEGTVSGETLQA